jgi:ABC-type uncharacterized transport system substrate-binding protein
MDRLFRIIVFAALMSMVFVSSNVPADNRFNVHLLVNSETTDHKSLLAALVSEVNSKNIGGKNISLETVLIDNFQHYSLTDSKPDLLITFGTEATLMVAEAGVEVPVLSVLIPRVSFDAIMSKHIVSVKGSNRNFSALFLDQPFTRRFALARELFRDADAIGIVLGPSTANYKDSLQTEARSYGFNLNLKIIENETQLLPALKQVLKNSQMLLTILDPLVFNRSNAQMALLTSYRYHVPIIGISPAYINAGALAAVYSTPEQIGRQLAEEILEAADKSAGWEPTQKYPNIFSVRTNKHIARSLGISLIEEHELERRLLLMTE